MCIVFGFDVSVRSRLALEHYNILRVRDVVKLLTITIIIAISYSDTRFLLVRRSGNSNWKRARCTHYNIISF